MSDRHYNAMRHAVALALSGQYNNWWAITARLRASRYRDVDLAWSASQRMWLDQLCGEARLARQRHDPAPPPPTRALLAVIEGGRRRGAPLEARPRQTPQLRALGGQLNHRTR